MEISLKIDLTDEQYQNLMKKSYDRIFEDEDFAEELKKSVANGIEEFMKSPDGKQMVRITLTGDDYYNISARKTALGERLFNEAIKEYVSEISIPIKEFMKECLLKVDIERIVTNIIIDIIRQSIIGTTVNELKTESLIQRGQINELREKLNMI